MTCRERVAGYDLFMKAPKGHLKEVHDGLRHIEVAMARSQPWWAGTEALAHTLLYDATVMGDYSLPELRAAKVGVPTLVLDGRASFGFMGETADALAKVLPRASAAPSAVRSTTSTRTCSVLP